MQVRYELSYETKYALVEIQRNVERAMLEGASVTDVLLAVSASYFRRGDTATAVLLRHAAPRFEPEIVKREEKPS